jgi:hypothetical protein
MISRSAPTNSRTSAWIISARFPASCGGKIVGSRLRVDVPVSSAPKSSAARPTPTPCCAEQRDGDADEADVRDLDVEHAEPELPAEDVERAGEAGEEPEIAIATTKLRPTLMPP